MKNKILNVLAIVVFICAAVINTCGFLKFLAGDFDSDSESDSGVPLLL